MGRGLLWNNANWKISLFLPAWPYTALNHNITKKTDSTTLKNAAFGTPRFLLLNWRHGEFYRKDVWIPWRKLACGSHCRAGSSRHFMHNFEFEVNFSTAKCRQVLERPQSVTMNVMAELFGLVKRRGWAVLTDVTRKFSAESNLDYHGISDTSKWPLTSIGAIAITEIFVDVPAETGCCIALWTCCSCFCAVIMREKRPNCPQISQLQIVINRQGLTS